MAKRFGRLYAELTGFENLWLAERKAARGKRGQPAVAAFEFDLEDELLRLQDELIAQTYRPGPGRFHRETFEVSQTSKV